jgi:hypothetical protein
MPGFAADGRATIIDGLVSWANQKRSTGQFFAEVAAGNDCD